MKRIAHRGNMSSDQKNIENTLQAFSNALSAVDGIELDVHMTRDGILVVFHDNEINRLTDGQGNLLDLDYDYIRTLRVNGEKIPTLEEVFSIMPFDKQIYIEIKQCERYGQYGKYPGIVPKVILLIEKYNLESQSIIISFDWYLLLESKEINKNIKTGALLDENLMLTEFNTLNCCNTRCIKRLKIIDIDYLIFDYRLLIKQKHFIPNNKWSLGFWYTKGTILNFSSQTIKIIISDDW